MQFRGKQKWTTMILHGFRKMASYIDFVQIWLIFIFAIAELYAMSCYDYPCYNERRCTCIWFLQSYIALLSYQSANTPVSIEQIRALVEKSISCKYHLKIECNEVAFHWDCRWVSYQEELVRWRDTAGTFCEYGGNHGQCQCNYLE